MYECPVFPSPVLMLSWCHLRSDNLKSQLEQPECTVQTETHLEKSDWNCILVWFESDLKKSDFMCVFCCPDYQKPIWIKSGYGKKLISWQSDHGLTNIKDLRRKKTSPPHHKWKIDLFFFIFKFFYFFFEIF